MSQRKLQIESLLKRAVATVIQRGLADPRIRGLISVTQVDVSPDLHNATVYVSIVPVENEALTMHGLRDATRHIQKSVNKQLAMRVVPHLLFKVDRKLKKQAEVYAAIHEAMQRTAATSAAQAPHAAPEADAAAEPAQEAGTGPAPQAPASPESPESPQSPGSPPPLGSPPPPTSGDN